MADREILMIVGCHRSGTSVLSGILSKLGWQLPKTLVGSSKWNQKGYFESPAIRDLNDAILQKIDRPVFDLRDMPEEFDPEALLSHFGKQIEETLSEQFGDAERILIKDPRLGRLLPVWQCYARETNQILRTIIALRHPQEVAASLNKRNTFSLMEGQLIWLRETLLALQHSRPLPTAQHVFADLFENWKHSLDKAYSQLGLEVPSLSPGKIREIEAFISVELRHHEQSSEAPPSEDWVSCLASQLFQSLLADQYTAMPDTITPLLNVIVNSLEELNVPAETGIPNLLARLHHLISLLLPHEELASETGRPMVGFGGANRAELSEKNATLEDRNHSLELSLKEAREQLTFRTQELAEILSGEARHLNNTRHLVLHVPGSAELSD